MLIIQLFYLLGAERYSNYSGYGVSFKWDGNHQDETPFDSSRRRMTSTVAIDALKFKRPNEQYEESALLRELNKVSFLLTAIYSFPQIFFSHLHNVKNEIF